LNEPLAPPTEVCYLLPNSLSPDSGHPRAFITQYEAIYHAYHTSWFSY